MSSVVEIGSWKGLSTEVLLQSCPGPVFAVDHFLGNPDERNGAHREATEHPIFPIFWENVGKHENLVVMRMESAKASVFFADKSVDMVFIDACHLYDHVLLDLQTWLPKCRKLICGHDAGMPGVSRALQDMKIDYKTSFGIWHKEF